MNVGCTLSVVGGKMNNRIFTAAGGPPVYLKKTLIMAKHLSSVNLSFILQNYNSPSDVRMIVYRRHGGGSRRFLRFFILLFFFSAAVLGFIFSSRSMKKLPAGGFGSGT